MLEEDKRSNNFNKEKFRFESFRASTSSLLASPNTSVKSENLNDGMKEKFPIKRYHASPSSLFANAPVVSDMQEMSLMTSSLEGYSGSKFLN